jgi:hypothetical protein
MRSAGGVAGRGGTDTERGGGSFQEWGEELGWEREPAVAAGVGMGEWEGWKLRLAKRVVKGRAWCR